LKIHACNYLFILPEEEIDVVTVEKLQQTSTTAGPTINKVNIQTRNIKTQIKIEKFFLFFSLNYLP
jgi:hypothetical protein